MLLAYVDPGLGALLWQAIVAGAVGFLFYLKKTRRWIVDRFLKMFGRGRKNEDADAEITINTEGLATKVESKTEVR
jgi:hypothetical protein